ncbi:MAG: hypothetical protein WBV39_11245, partial [Rudaea sp.]
MTTRGSAHHRGDGHDRSRGGGLRLARAYRIGSYLVFGSTWITGILWLIFHYFLQRQGAFGAEPHPLEAWWLCLHGAGAFAALWICGLLWGLHVRPGLQLPRRRISGIVLIVMLVLLIASGYLLYYAGGERLRDAVRLLHWVVGLAIVVPLVLHVLRAKAWREKHKSLRQECSERLRSLGGLRA